MTPQLQATPSAPAVHERLAVEIAAWCELSDDARMLLTDDSSASEYFRHLAQAKCEDDAIRFAASWLPPRQGVWWGALCNWEAYRGDAGAAINVAFDAVVRWIEQPSDERRRAVGQLIKTVGAATPIGVLLQAVTYSGGSISPPHLPRFDPDRRIFTKLLAEAVSLAAKMIGVSRDEDCRATFLKFAWNIAHGKLSWQRIEPK